MTSATRIIAGLGAGLAAGAVLAAWAPSLAGPVAAVAAPIGGLWLNGLQMTIVPLVLALLVRGIGTASDAAEAGGVAARAVALFAAILLASAVIGALLFPAMLALWPQPERAAAALRGGLAAAAAVPAIPPLGDWLRGIVPPNPVQAAAEAAMLPLVVFGIVFGFAVARLAPDHRAALTLLFDAIAEAMLVIVGWVLALAPAGVFALALATAAHTGLAAIGGLAHYVALYVLLLLIFTAGAYPLAVIGGRQPLGRFARAALPAQSIGFSTQSSLAALPAMLTAARDELKLGERGPAIVLPMAVTLMRATSPAANLAIVLYVAALVGMPVGPGALAAGVLVAAVISLASVGVPSQVTFFITTVPIALAMGVPVAPLALLIAVEVIPDLVRTTGNVAYDLAATTVAARAPPEA
ncbi:dicarboxylate/amino acid:cation symporter [Sphingomonas flavalba]|uniref:dicarboxylate/amino acid:cation symporter n=1 Tax=Sphingomonas flavalba TaxID=2559804 RepID=UPI00109DCDE2|nr:cation:dicarboxylase symporter family transporter [Sphingomonas flavalba]